MEGYSSRIPELLDEIEKGNVREDGLILSEKLEKQLKVLRKLLRAASFIPRLRGLKKVSQAIGILLAVDAIVDVVVPGTIRELEQCKSRLNSAENAEKILNDAIDGLIEKAEDRGCDHV